MAYIGLANNVPCSNVFLHAHRETRALLTTHGRAGRWDAVFETALVDTLDNEEERLAQLGSARRFAETQDPTHFDKMSCVGHGRFLLYLLHHRSFGVVGE